MSDNSIKSNSIKGMAWTGAERLANIVIQFIIGIIIARVLMPSDYGIIGMLAIFIAIAQSILDSGFANALIQKKDRNDIDYSTVFYFNIVVSILIYALFYISSPFIAKFYDMPILTDVARVVSLSLIINGFSVVQTAKLSIDLNFKLQSIASIVSVLIAGGVGILMAYRGLGVWALVAQSVITAVVRTLILWLYSSWRPIWIFSVESFNQLFAFGSKLLCSGLINTIYDNLYTLVIGRFFSVAEVGYFTRGNQFALLPSSVITQMVLKVNYPILSSLQDDDVKLIAAYKKLLRVPIYILYPILFGLGVLAEPLVLIMLGSKWLPCVQYIQILCLSNMWTPLTHFNLNLLYVKGKSDKVLKLELIKKPIAFAILLASIPFGIWWMCASQVIYSFIAFTFNCYYTKKILNYGLFAQIKEILPIVVNVSIMSLLIILSVGFFSSALLKLVVGCIVGIMSFIAFSIFTRDTSFHDLLDIIKTRFVK